MGRHCKPIARALALGCCAALFAGCGTPPVLVDSGKTLNSLKMVEGAQAPRPPDPQALSRQIIADIGAVRQTTRNLRCDLTGFFVSLKNGKSGSTLSDLYFEKPNKTALVVHKSSDGAVDGTKLVWLGGSKMAVKTKFLGFWLKTSIDIHHEYAKDPRGYFIDETGIEATLNTLTDNRNQVTYQGNGTLDNIPIVKLGIVSPRSLKGVARESFVIDTQRKIPLVREMYDGAGKLVFRIKMDKVALNTALPATTFQVE